MKRYFVIDRATGAILAAKLTMAEARQFSKADEKGHPLTFIIGPMSYDDAEDFSKGYDNRATKSAQEGT